MLDPMIGKMLDNRYEILELIGSGGMANVYKAKCHRLNRMVAVKVLKSDLAQDAEFRRRFRDESQAVAMLSHPNIMTIYDVSRSETEYIVMELIDGITLKQYMERRGKLNWREALHFITQIMRGLRHAHSRGIVHRDIKPQNIMVLRDGSIKVADFGIACLSNKAQTMTQEALGSVHYISPEQAKGNPPDARSDIYSAGVVLYEMLTDRLPFEGDSAVAVVLQHLSGVPLTPREINPDVPEALEKICMKAMASDIEKRYPTADAMLSDLEEFRKNPEVELDFTVEDVRGHERADEPTQPVNVHRPAAPKQPPAEEEDEAEEIDHRRQKGILVAGILVLAAVLVFGLGKLIANSFPKEQPVVEYTVPSLLGLTVEQAQEMLAADGVFTVTQIGSRASDKYPAGQILEQSPSAERKVRIGQEISVFVSTGVRTESMLDLCDMEYRNGQIMLDRLDLSLDSSDVRYEFSDDVASGCIIRTEPAAGEALHEGDKIVLYVSRGAEPKPVQVPAFTGMSVDALTSACANAGLTRGDVTRRFDAAPAGTVIEQSIAPLSVVDEGTVITFVVSDGPEEQVVTPQPSEGEETPEEP